MCNDSNNTSCCPDVMMSQVCAEHALSCPVLGVSCLAFSIPVLVQRSPISVLSCSDLFPSDLSSPMLCTLLGTPPLPALTPPGRLSRYWASIWAGAHGLSGKLPALCVPVPWTVCFWYRLTFCHGVWAGIWFHGCSLVTVVSNLSLFTVQ